MAGFAFLSENVSILAWILSLRFYIVAFKLLRITIVPEGLLANSLIAAWGCWRCFRYFFFGVAFGIFFSALQRCVLPDFSQGLKEACCLVPPRSRKGMRCLALF